MSSATWRTTSRMTLHCPALPRRHAAVCDLKYLRFGGWFAWVTWLLVHIAYLIEYDTRLRVLAERAWSYFTRKRGPI